MERATWTTRSLADVPDSDDWLGPRERALLASLPEVPKRRASWRLGRWTAKALLGAEAEILSAPDGAPLVEGVALSLSHRHGRALAVTAPGGVALGCDLEPGEQEEWAAREAAAKVRRDGVLRAAEVTVAPGARGWRDATVFAGGRRLGGRVRVLDGWTLAVFADVPVLLADDPAPLPA
jgi:4'-phosphopantetheinyl transferase EntD